ncbi:MAG: PfkB family carbohydrate kinase [Spirochaetales bacterium]|nr:PfkB family carbohydrate kinase [Spirochaetales bacterium]
MKQNIDILAAGLSPALQKTVLFDSFREGEVNRALRYYTDASGKCVNVARVLLQGGVDTACLTPLGRDNRDEFTALGKRDGLPLYSVPTEGRVRTCTTIVDLNRKICSELVVNEPEEATATQETEYLGLFESLLERVSRAVVISGSRLPGFSENIIPEMVRKTKERGLLLFADYRTRDLKASYMSETIRPDYVKINEEEFLQTFDEADLTEGLIRQSRAYKSRFIISRGSESTLAADYGELFEVPSRMVEPLNAIGCGDAMTAGLAQGICEGLTLKDAVIRGRDYAAANVQSIHPGWILPDS